MLAPANLWRIEHGPALHKKLPPQLGAAVPECADLKGSTRKPASRSAAAAACTAARVSGVTEPGRHPRKIQSCLPAVRRNSAPAMQSADSAGSCGSWPLSVRNISATSAMVRAIGPIAPSVENGPTHGGRCPRPGIRPGVGLSEQMPVKCAGTRTEPPLSLPRPGRRKSRRNGCRLAAARSARRAFTVPWVVGAPMQQVRCLVGHQKLGAIGRAQDQRSRRAQTRNDDSVFAWEFRPGAAGCRSRT
jgi:hypothetical protein